MAEDQPPRVSSPKQKAAGAAAVASSLNHVIRSAGITEGTKALLRLNQYNGFDCPSCAWPDPDDHRTRTEFCENGAKAIASEVNQRRIDRDFFSRYSIAELRQQTDYWHDQQGRLAEPFVRLEHSPNYHPISWEEAFLLIARELNSLPSPDEGIFYTSGRASNEAAFLYQLFVRNFGTNNLPDCSNMCHESSGTALKESIGIGKGTVTLEDFYQAETIICIGQNPGTNHPRMLSALETAVENDARIVAINPLREAGLLGFAHPQKLTGMLNRATPLASQYLQVKVSGDLALLRALGKEFFSREQSRPGSVIDQAFIDQHTLGIDEYRRRCEQISWAELLEKSAVSRAEIRQLADTMLRGERRLITCWAMGLTQHRNAVATIREIANLHLLLGAIGRPGAGLCPVRGHSNVQGDRTMGIFERMPESFLGALDQQFGITCPRDHGHDTVSAILSMHEKPGQAFIALGGNFLQAAPDTDFTTRALERCRITVHIATKLNRSHLHTGRIGLILPCLGRSEHDEQAAGPQFVTCENSMGVVQRSQGSLEPASPKLLSETHIISRLAEATLGTRSRIGWESFRDDYDRIRDAIEQVIPGFQDYNRRARKEGGFYLPNGAKERVWATEEGKAVFSSARFEQFEVAEGHLILQTLRSHDQFNTTIYGLNDRYRGIGLGRRIIFLNPDDMKDRAIPPVTLVDITSHWKGEQRRVERFYAIPYDMPPGTAAAYFPEANPLIPLTSTALQSNTPTSKAVEISLQLSNNSGS